MDAARQPAAAIVIRVLLVDDQAVVRAGLKLILEAQDDIEVLGEAADGSEAVALTRALDPDVVLMDIRMPVLDGIEATRQLTATGTDARVLILTTYGLDEYVYEALQAGAAGFLLKTDPPERLVEGVRVVAAGEALLAPDITRRLIDHYLGSPAGNAPPPSALAELTAREREVLEQLTRGLSNAEIAQTLYITEGTAKTHVARILAKLDLRDRVQAVIYAYENGLVQAGTRDTQDPGS
jgi:DNA-binding NarL/FixJ family response regulator